MGELQGTKMNIKLNENAEPKFFKPRPVPYALKQKVEDQLKKLESEKVITKVTHCEWAAPIVVVPKSDGSVRLCGDFKVTINSQMKVDQYPLPTAQDMFSKLSNGVKFSKLDLSQAYHQYPMSEESKKFVTINTHIGLFQYNRLPYGIASGPAVFQKYMEEILAGIDGVQVFIDDIQVTGKSEKEHLENLHKVMSKLEQNGVRLNKDKCKFLSDSIDYLGHTIDSEGLHPQEGKVKAIMNAAKPHNVKELRSFLGGIQYYAKFLPNLSATLKPLHQLLQKDVSWMWSDDCDKAFIKVKEFLASRKVLTHYNPELQLRLASDASPRGLGAVISHIMPNGDERPIAYASRSLTKTEGNYSQIEKEALGIIFGVRKFHQYLYGRKFTLITDHKPLVKLFGPNCNMKAMAAARIQRWSLELSAYNYDIEYRRSEEHSNADMLSRLPQTTNEGEEEKVFFSYVNEMPMSAGEIAQATKCDPVLSKVLTFTLNGWPTHDNEINEQLKPYFQRRDDISVESDVLQWGLRVIVPETFRRRVLDELHEGHHGIVKTKAIARSYVYWPNIDKDIELTITNCQNCASVKNMPRKAPVLAWTFPSRPWERLHIDFAEIDGHHYLIVIDAYSKWPEIVHMNKTNAQSTADALRQIFSTHGLPITIVSDNGPPFRSAEFSHFLQMNGIRHVTSQPYQPSTNGSAERLVQTFKRMMKVMKPMWTRQQKLAKILLNLRSTPHAMTGKSPAELLFKRNVRIRLDLIKPNFSSAMRNRQEDDINQRNENRHTRSFQPGDAVQVKNYRHGYPSWSTGIVLQQLGPVSYSVNVNGAVRHCHVNQMQSSPQNPESVTPVCDPHNVDSDDSEKDIMDLHTPAEHGLSAATHTKSFQDSYNSADDIIPAATETNAPQRNDTTSQVHERRYPIRNRKQIQRLNYSR